jgi:Raf kinase inhibitor-like YbhB/YbcL family protein
MRKSLSLLLLTLVPTIAVADIPLKSAGDAVARAMSKKLVVTSPAFANQGPIPTAHTCEGEGIAVPLAWSKVPPGTKSIALVAEDPDAVGGAFTQWLVVGIPPTAKKLDKGGALPKGAVAAKNDNQTIGYAAPCPPTGVHKYHFRVFALDVLLDRPMTKMELSLAIEGHVLAEGELVGTYQKKDDPGMAPPPTDDDAVPEPPPAEREPAEQPKDLPRG